MNPATVLMCWNIPRIPEDVIYELFSIAGPIEDISFAKNGKACFIIYEHVEAVVTAKEIFKDMKINGRQWVMYDYHEIERIYSMQEEQSTYAREINDNASINFNYNSRNGSSYHSRLSSDSRMYSTFNRNPSDYQTNERYFGANQVSSGNRPYSVSHNPDYSNDFSNDSHRSSSMRNSSMSGCSYQNREDLLPSSGPSSQKRKYDRINSMNDPNDLEAFMNPYETPVSRNCRDVSNASKFDNNDFDDIPPGVNMNDYMKEKWESSFGPDANKSKRVKPSSDFRKNSANHFDPLNAFRDLVSRGDARNERHNGRGNHRDFGHYRGHSNHIRFSDGEHSHNHGSKSHQPHKETHHKFRNPFRNERDRRYDNRSRRY